VEAETTAYSGHLHHAIELWSSARQAAARNGSADRARWPELDLGLANAEFGMSAGALKAARHALKDAEGTGSRTVGALVLARAGDIQLSEQIVAALAKQKPSDTLLNYYWIAAVRASIALRRGKGQEAVDLLEPALQYETGTQSYSYASLYPIYLRGQGYLLAKNGALAAAEFEKLIQYRNLGFQSPSEALAQLWLGRALALQAQESHTSETEQFKLQARAAYQKFLTQWKDADSNIPVLKQANAEYAKLQ
jgi:eukaryotic-like serine/threonine-protein kinase